MKHSKKRKRKVAHVTHSWWTSLWSNSVAFSHGTLDRKYALTFKQKDIVWNEHIKDFLKLPAGRFMNQVNFAWSKSRQPTSWWCSIFRWTVSTLPWWQHH